MSNAALVCWKCGASLADLSLPLSRTDECRACRAEYDYGTLSKIKRFDAPFTE